MSAEIRVPELGDLPDAEVIEIYVEPGDDVGVDDPLIALETDKAAMDVPSPRAGRIESVDVAVGDRVAAGDPIVTLSGDVADDDDAGDGGVAGEKADAAAESAGDEADAADAEPAARSGESSAGASRGADSGASAPAAAPRAAAHDAAPQPPGKRLVVLGSGPGGYTAAFRAADLGLEVTLVERWPSLGGVCLNVGCIPSKALLHAARVVEETSEVREFGIDFGAPKIDTAKLRDWKNRVVGQLTNGLKGLAKKRNVTVVTGVGRFASPNRLEVEHDGETSEIEFDQCIIAAGSESIALPALPDDPRVMDSADALELEELPERMLVIGGGIIGLEMATVYAALGVAVSVVELTETLMPGCDRDLVKPLEKRIAERYEAVMLGTKVTGAEATDAGIRVSFEGRQAPGEDQTYGRVLVAVGRKPNGGAIAADKAGVDVDARGFIGVDKQMRTNVPHIFAIGDIVGPPMLAHKATHEGKVAAEVAAGHKSFFDARVIPSVAYTDPEVAWVGVREEEAKETGRAFEKGVFPWAASGRSLSLGRSEGLTKLLFDEADGRLIGAGIVGPNAGDLIAEAALAIEMGCDAADVGLTIHPHPTLSETVAFAAEAAEGTITDLYIPKKR